MIKEKHLEKENPEILISAVYLTANKVAPDFKGIELGCGDSILSKALEKVTGRTKKAIAAKYEKAGDLGVVAEEFKKSQKTLFGRKPSQLVLQRVHKGMFHHHGFHNMGKDLLRIAAIGAQEEKSKIIERLLVAATPKEARYLIRCLQGKLRIGLAEQTVLISLAHALSSSIKPEVRDEAAELLKQVSVRIVLNQYLKYLQAYCELPIYDDIIKAALRYGMKGLKAHCGVRVGVPLKPMLAKPMNGISQVLGRFDHQKCNNEKTNRSNLRCKVYM